MQESKESYGKNAISLCYIILVEGECCSFVVVTKENFMGTEKISRVFQGQLVCDSQQLYFLGLRVLFPWMWRLLDFSRFSSSLVKHFFFFFFFISPIIGPISTKSSKSRASCCERHTPACSRKGCHVGQKKNVRNVSGYTVPFLLPIYQRIQWLPRL